MLIDHIYDILVICIEVFTVVSYWFHFVSSDGLFVLLDFVDNESGEKLVPVAMTPAINLSTVLFSGCVKCLWMCGGSNATICDRLRRLEISLFWFELVLAASGASDQGG
jgi:hypothetical protein